MSQNEPPNPLKSGLKIALEDGGFRKKSDSWYRDDGEVIKVVNLQKSQFGRQYYLNLGFYVKALGPELFPKERHCHLRSRANRFCQEEADLDRLLNLDDPSYSIEERMEAIRSLVSDRILPFLKSCGSVAGLKQALKTKEFSQSAVVLKFQEILGL